MASGMLPPILIHWSQAAPLQYETSRRDPQLRCGSCVQRGVQQAAPDSLPKAPQSFTMNWRIGNIFAGVATLYFWLRHVATVGSVETKTETESA